MKRTKLELDFTPSHSAQLWFAAWMALTGLLFIVITGCQFARMF